MSWSILNRLSVATVLVIFLTGCTYATGKKFIPNDYYAIKEDIQNHPDQAAVYVFWATNAGANLSFSLKLNGEPVSQLKSFGYYHRSIPPDRITFTLTPGHNNALNLNSLPLEAEGGKVYFIKLNWKSVPGFLKPSHTPYLELVSDEIKALNDLDQCQEIQR